MFYTFEEQGIVKRLDSIGSEVDARRGGANSCRPLRLSGGCMTNDSSTLVDVSTNGSKAWVSYAGLTHLCRLFDTLMKLYGSVHLVLLRDHEGF